jgi:hypothetical protein
LLNSSQLLVFKYLKGKNIYIVVIITCLLEKKGEIFREPGFEFLRNASERELFYLHNGITISGVRDLVVQVINMDDHSFSLYVSASENVFSSWFESVFKDKELGFNVKNEKSRTAFINVVVERICELEERKLKKFGFNISKDKLLLAEKYIEARLARGDPAFVIHKNLVDTGWNRDVLDLILESGFIFYKNFTSVQNLFDVNSAQKKFEELKKNIITAIADGLSLNEVFEYLMNQGWPKNILNYILLHVYKPRKNITKLSWFIIKEIGDKKKNLGVVKDSLVNLGWKDYLIDHLIHRINNFDDDLDQILNCISSFEFEEKNRIQDFLKKNGWDDALITQAIKNREINKFWHVVSQSLNLDDNLLRFNSDLFKDNIVKFKSSTGANELWGDLISGYKKVNISDFSNSGSELHMTNDYIHYYSERDVNSLLEFTKKGFLKKLIPGSGVSFYYSNEVKPLLCEIDKSKFLIAPRVISKSCISCKVEFPITKMVKVEIWDATRTHKVTKYVCRQHEKIVNTLMDETRIVQ